MNSSPNEEWTSPKMLDKLRLESFPFRAKQPVSSVSGTLHFLYRKDRIALSRQGTGSLPNTYKALPKKAAKERENQSLSGDGAQGIRFDLN